MVDANQEPVSKGGTKKKKRHSPQKAGPKDKGEDKGVVSNLPGKNDSGPDKKESTSVKKESAHVKKESAPVKKDSTPVKSQSVIKTQVATKKQTIANVKKFLKGAWSELKKVHWLGRRELVAFTGVVLIAVTIVAILIFLVDTSLSKLLQVFLRK